MRDELNQKLITLLRHNARQNVSDMAVALGVSRATVRARMEQLERTGIILGYAAILKTETADQSVRGIMMIDIEGHATDRVVRALSGFAEISAIHSTNGRWDLVVELGTDTLGSFDAVLRRIRLIPGIVGSETSLLLATSRSTGHRS